MMKKKIIIIAKKWRTFCLVNSIFWGAKLFFQKEIQSNPIESNPKSKIIMISHSY